uniref:Uncharacterized protein n=1 Tax=Tanacetum cinerariifolium TaxID=118510 RepID=A0A6L2JQ69_TANCI|nr:hypothetical protein [Tanacetum cinerariifolium]
MVVSGGQSVKPNVKYVYKAAISVPKRGASNVVNTFKSGSSHAPSIKKNNHPKASVLLASSSGSPNGKNGGNTSNINVSNSYVMLDEESEAKVENVFDESVNLLSSAKTWASSSTYTASDALEWHLEEIHVTWAHLGKKQTRLRLYTKSFEETVHTERGDGVAITKRWRQNFHIDGATVDNTIIPSCFVIFDLYPLSLSFDFVFMSEIIKSLSFSLDRLCHLAILCLDQHAHTLHHLESLLTISLDRLDILKEDLVYQRFPTQSIGSSNTEVLDSPCLLVLITGTSQSRQHAFYFDDDHIKEISSGGTITHSDISLSKYDSFIFDFAHEEFVDELSYIISPLKYDCFYFWNLPDPGELMSVLNSGICENLPSATSVNLPIEDDHSPLLAYVASPLIIFSSKPGLPHRCGAFKKFNTHRSHLNECPMIINGKNIPILDVLLFYFYPPCSSQVKEKQEKDKIRSKPDKNGKRGEAEKSLKLLQLVEQEKLSKTQKEWPKTQTQSKAIQVIKKRKK